MTETKEQRFIRWAIGDLLLGKYQEGIRSITWAIEEREKIESEAQEKNKGQEHGIYNKN